MNDAELPSAELSRAEAEWLRPARARLLRRAAIARRARVLELGCGHGAVTDELARRSGGMVVAVDLRRWALQAGNLRSRSGAEGAVAYVAADARRLPFGSARFDLVFCQWLFLWADAPQVAAEAFRVLVGGGALVAIEPDYGGMIEHPEPLAVRDVWIDALRRAGADPLVGRKLPGALAAAGFQVRVDLVDRLEPPAAERFRLLEELPLDESQGRRLDAARRFDAGCPAWAKTVHLPFFLVLAEKPPAAR